MDKNPKKISKNLNETILRYPFNGRSKYLIDKFYIMGYDGKTLDKYLIENNIDDNNINKSNNSLNLSIEDLFSKSESKKIPQVFHIDQPPTILNEITSDYKKQMPDKDLIKDMIFPNKIDFFYIEESLKIKSLYSEENNFKSGNRQTTLLSKITFNSNEINDNDIINGDFSSIYVDDDNIKYIKPYNVIFSYNPQTENNSKNSINGLAHVFYRKYYKNKNNGDKIISFYVPVIFCIISEFPFYNSFYLLCNQIKQLYMEKHIEMPLEILIYNIINFTLSPLNNDIFLYIEPINFPTKTIELKPFHKNKKNNFNFSQIKEEDLENNIIYIENNNEEETNIMNNIKATKPEKSNKDSGFYTRRNRGNTNYNNFKINKLEKNLNNNKSKDNIFSNIYEDKDEGNVSDDKSLNKSADRKDIRKSLSQKKLKIKRRNLGEKKNKIKSIYNLKLENHKLTDLKNANNSFSQNSITSIDKNYDNIKFCFLPGYPLIQYNLVKVLLNILSPQDVIIIFFHSFLEKDIVFFSKDIEYLSLSIDAYLNLNFPLNDEKYYFFNACVSYENYINNNSTFVGSTFTTMIGVNNPYLSEYKNTNMAKSKEHLCVDLDNGNLHFIKGGSYNSFGPRGDINIFDFIKKICKNKDFKEEREKETILCREIKILYEKLNDYKNRLNNKNNIEFYNNISKYSYIDYNEQNKNSNINIKNINKDIQEAFYRLTNNLCLYFYQNLSLKDEINNPNSKPTKEKVPIKSSIRKSLRSSVNIDTMSIIFKKDYLLDDDDNIYSKEELAFLNELTDTMKFESFVYGFIQSYNPIDLYKIPLTFTEEFLSILLRKNTNLKNINFEFLSLIDILYERNIKKKLFVDLNPFLSKYYKLYKSYFDREIYDLFCKNINNSSIGINFKNIIDNKIVIESFKYKSYELDKNILLKYRTFINNLDLDEYHTVFYLSSALEQNDIKHILLTDIENIIEKYSIEIGLLSQNDICCSNIILLFIISIKSIINQENIDCAGFLFSLYQNFVVFRKYYTMIMKILYQLMKKSLNNNDYNQAKKYYFCYYPCINSLRNLKIVPNESLMNIIKKFNSIKIDALLQKQNNPINNNSINSKNDLELNYNYKFIHITHNFDNNKFYKINEIIDIINNNKTEVFLSSTRIFEPKIIYQDNNFKYKCKFISQAKILQMLTEQYNIFYNNDFNENKLINEDIINACLNIDTFLRNSEDFKDKEYVIYSLQCICNVYLNKLNILNKNKVKNNK